MPDASTTVTSVLCDPSPGQLPPLKLTLQSPLLSAVVVSVLPLTTTVTAEPAIAVPVTTNSCVALSPPTVCVVPVPFTVGGVRTSTGGLGVGVGVGVGFGPGSGVGVGVGSGLTVVTEEVVSSGASFVPPPASKAAPAPPASKAAPPVLPAPSKPAPPKRPAPSIATCSPFPLFSGAAARRLGSSTKIRSSDGLHLPHSAVEPYCAKSAPSAPSIKLTSLSVPPELMNSRFGFSAPPTKYPSRTMTRPSASTISRLLPCRLYDCMSPGCRFKENSTPDPILTIVSPPSAAMEPRSTIPTPRRATKSIVFMTYTALPLADLFGRAIFRYVSDLPSFRHIS